MRQLVIPHLSTGRHARRFRVLASFSLRSDAHVLKYAPLRSSRKPRQNPNLAGGGPLASRSGRGASRFRNAPELLGNLGWRPEAGGVVFVTASAFYQLELADARPGD